jgi:predicted small metal-binding protein
MTLYKVSYYLYYDFSDTLLSGDYQMYAQNVKEIFDKAFDHIRENETEYEEREFVEEKLTGIEIQFQPAKNQHWDGSPKRKMTYALKDKKTGKSKRQS